MFTTKKVRPTPARRRRRPSATTIETIATPTARPRRRRAEDDDQHDQRRGQAEHLAAREVLLGRGLKVQVDDLLAGGGDFVARFLVQCADGLDQPLDVLVGREAEIELDAQYAVGGERRAVVRLEWSSRAGGIAAMPRSGIRFQSVQCTSSGRERRRWRPPGSRRAADRTPPSTICSARFDSGRFVKSSSVVSDEPSSMAIVAPAAMNAPSQTTSVSFGWRALVRASLSVESSLNMRSLRSR